MNADSAFVIGKTHAVCQDYVVAKPNCVILSDGCSSSPDTDIGARLLVRCAEKNFKIGETKNIASLHLLAAAEALELAWMLGLEPQSIDATLVTAHFEHGELIVACSGDGVIILQNRWRGIEVYSISYPSGFPCYPSYTHQPDRLASSDFEKEVRCFRGLGSEALRLDHARTSNARTEILKFNASDYEFVVLVSDGIHSFSSTTGSTSSRGTRSIEFQTIARELVAFKNVRGEFVGRRLKRFLKDVAFNGWQHADDLSVGAIYLGE
jgi:serine/threonine protein phosphatase PrpC